MPKKTEKEKKISKLKLPNKLIAISNSDKNFHERWKKSRNLLNFPHPFRAVLMGPPNKGKSTTIKNLILRSSPAFKEIFCIHCDADYTSEWDDIGVKMLKEIPSPDQWEGKVKTLVILDDVEFKSLSKIQKANLDRLVGFVSTHKNISVCITSQDVFNIPAIVRRCSNLWVLWKSNDIISMSSVAGKSGMILEEFKSIFDNLITEDRDSLWIDNTSGSPAPLRKNGYEIIDKN